MEESQAFKHHGGSGIWQDIENVATGQRSLKEHKLKVVWQSCPPDECYFEVPDPTKRVAVCNKCEMGKNFVLGIHNVKDGKIINLR